MHRFTLALATAAVLAIPGAAQAQVGVGALAAWHDNADFGIGAFVDVPMEGIHENVHLMGDFTLFFPDFGDFFEVNGNLLFDFPMTEQDFTPFVLGGMNIARASTDAVEGGTDSSNTELGLNIGGGLTFGMASLRPSVGLRAEIEGGEGVVIFGLIRLGG